MRRRATNTTALRIGNALVHCTIADTPEQHLVGLSKHASLSDGEGMLFVFDPPRTATFWMSDVAFPIDIVGISTEGNIDTISRIAEGCAPGSLSQWTFHRAAYVLEVPSGWCRRHGVGRGAAVEVAYWVPHKTARNQDEGWLSPADEFYSLERLGANSHTYAVQQHPELFGVDLDVEESAALSDEQVYQVMDQVFRDGWIRVVTTGVETTRSVLRRRLPDIERVLRNLAPDVEWGALYVHVDGEDIEVPIDHRNRPDFSQLRVAAGQRTARRPGVGWLNEENHFYPLEGDYDSHAEWAYRYMNGSAISTEIALLKLLEAGWIRLEEGGGMELTEKTLARRRDDVIRLINSSARGDPPGTQYYIAFPNGKYIPLSVTATGRVDFSPIDYAIGETKKRTAARDADEGWLSPDNEFYPLSPCTLQHATGGQSRHQVHDDWAYEHMDQFGVDREATRYPPKYAMLADGWLRIIHYGGVEVFTPEILRQRMRDIKRTVTNMMSGSAPGDSAYVDVTRPGLHALVTRTPTGRIDFSRLDGLVDGLARESSHTADAINEQNVQIQQIRDREDDGSIIEQYSDRMMLDDQEQTFFPASTEHYQETMGHDIVHEPGQLGADEFEEPLRYSGASGQDIVRDIVVTIPASKLKDVEVEEREVAKRVERGERDINYYWSMGRLPKEQPERIYFLWDGAVRAYHNVVSMDREGGRIYMQTEIHKLDAPMPMTGFRGFRYMNERPSGHVDHDEMGHTAVGNADRQRIKDEGTELIIETPKWKAFAVNSLDACQLYGHQTRWCITQPEYWDTYAKNDTAHDWGRRFVFIVGKGPNARLKYVAIVEKDGFIAEVRDANDREVHEFDDDWKLRDVMPKVEQWARQNARRPRTAQIVDEAKFVEKVADLIFGNLGHITWTPDALNGQTERAIVSRRELAKWLEGHVDQAGLSHVLDAASTERGLSLIGDAFILLGEADMANVGFASGAPGLVLRRSLRGGNSGTRSAQLPPVPLPCSVCQAHPSRKFISAFGNEVSYLYDGVGIVALFNIAGGPALATAEEAWEVESLDRAAASTPRFTSEVKPINMEDWQVPLDGDILSATLGGQAMQRFSWNPVSGEFIPQAAGRHADMLHGRNFDDFVRGIIFPQEKLVTLRVFWPSWAQDETRYDDEDVKHINFEAQHATKEAIETAGAQGWRWQFNITNAALTEMTGHRFW